MNLEEHIHNDPKQIAIRKCQSNLIIVGTGVIALAVWTAIKEMIVLVVLRSETVEGLKKLSGPDADDIPDRLAFITITVMFLLLMLIIVATRLYVGRSAIAEGRGGRGRRGYLLLAALMVILGCINIYTDISFLISRPAQADLGAFTRDTSFSAVIIEITSVIMVAEMLYSAIMIRRLKALGNHGRM